jgi:hypothetical protein
VTFKTTTKIFCLLPYFWMLYLHHFLKTKNHKEVTKVTKQKELRFSCYFCLNIEGSGSVLRTNGSGSRRPKNIRLLRIRIRNTVSQESRFTQPYQQIFGSECTHDMKNNTYGYLWGSPRSGSGSTVMTKTKEKNFTDPDP